jgi:hypothetical protein
VAPAANVAAPAKPAPKVIAPRELDVQSLKPLPGGMITRYGLDELKINMVNPQSDRNPYGSAIINGKKVFENSYISGSQILLKKVVDDGIAVEISRTGEQFYKHF